MAFNTRKRPTPAAAMRRLGLLLAAVLLLSVPAASLAQETLAHRIWHDMAQEGQIDLSKGWEFEGMYTFGETTGDGYITLFTTKDGQSVSGSVTWRIYPKSEEDITVRYLPMLKVLLTGIYGEELHPDVFAELDALQPQICAAFKRSSAAQWEMAFPNCVITIKYSSKHNELYCLIENPK